MWITPLSPVARGSGERVTWLNSQWKLCGYPGHIWVEINTQALWCAAPGLRGTCACRNPTNAKPRWSSTCRSARTATVTTLSRPDGGNAPVGDNHAPMHRPPPGQGAGRPGFHSGRQGGATETCGHEAVNGSPDPSFQTLHRRLSCTGRRGLRGRRGTQGRVRRVSSSRWYQQALSLQASGTRIRTSPSYGLTVPRPHAARSRTNASTRPSAVSCSILLS